MKFHLLCGTWIKEDDEKVLNVLEASDKMLSAEELSAITGLPLHKVDRTLRFLARQEKMYWARHDFLNQ